MPKPLALTWNLSEMHGWGLLGVHTALYLMDIGRPPLLLEKPLMNTLRPENQQRLSMLLGGYDRITQLAASRPDAVLKLEDCDVLHGLANGFVAGPLSERFRGARNIGVVAYEDTRMPPEVLARARSYDAMVVHSSFNRRLLEDRGVPNVRVAFQGVDPSEIQPGSPDGRFGDRFVIFSGGKVEFRKGQDIVLAAFRVFHARHPEALLITNWFNAWPATAMGIAESPHTPVAPRTDERGRVDIKGWAVANGVAPTAFLDLGFLSRDKIAGVLANCHAAVFPNRCEGATNLVAMEAMACEVPVVLSANTGHLDILSADHVYPLSDQRPVVDRDGGRVEWGESSVDELVARLEEIFADRAAAAARAARAGAFMRRERTWRHFAETFIEAIDRP